jgi:hypothetical protein
MAMTTAERQRAFRRRQIEQIATLEQDNAQLRADLAEVQRLTAQACKHPRRRNRSRHLPRLRHRHVSTYTRTTRRGARNSAPRWRRGTRETVTTPSGSGLHRKDAPLPDSEALTTPNASRHMWKTGGEHVQTVWRAPGNRTL